MGQFMDTFHVDGVNHASFTVAGLDETVTFFRDCLGAEVLSVFRPPSPDGIRRITGVSDAQVRIAFLRLQQQTIELLEYEQPEARQAQQPRPCDPGFAHLAINVRGVAAFCEKARDFGYERVGDIVEMQGGPDIGKHAVYLQSASGITLEVIGL